MLMDNRHIEIKDIDDILPGIAQCSVCDWEGNVRDCHSEMWGDWTVENTYIVDYCPECHNVIGQYVCTEWENTNGVIITSGDSSQ